MKNYIIYIFLCLLSLSAPVGHFIGSGTLLKIGLASLASPLMIVYSEMEGKRLMSFSYQLEIRFEGADSQIILLDKKKYLKMAEMENPFNRHIMILPYMAGIMVYLGKGKAEDIRKQILEYGLCDQGPFSEYLGVKELIKGARITLFTDKTHSEIYNEYEVNC